MKAIAGPGDRHVELREEYRVALGIWSEARALYAYTSPEVSRATEHLETLEHQLAQLDRSPIQSLVPALEAQG